MSSQPGPRAVIVLAAGAGTRMRSATPKVLHRIGGRSLLAHAVIAAAGSGAEHVVVVVGHARERVAAELDAVATRHGIVVSVAVQEQQRGTGDAVAAGVAGLPADARGTVVVTSGDVPLLSSDTLTALVAEHSGGAATILTTVLTDPTGYGRVLRDADGSVRAVVEEADATPVQREITEVNGGVYAFDLSVLRTTLGRLTSENAQGERYLPDVLALARRDGHPVGALSVADPWLLAGVNDRVQLSAAGAELNRRTLERWMRQGVTVRDTANTWVDVEVELAADVELLPGTQLCGRTSVGGGARIGPDTTLTDVTVGEDAEVVRTHSDAAVIGAGVKVGPFAYLRPGTHLHAGAKIGTFVETKNAVVGAGSKVPHLTYVGDATIGEHSNIGASSVFVNYDGVQKRRTVIGSHVRTGSDTMFIAPVEVGDGAYTGAGTVVREDVPAGALAVSGGPQRTIPNWVLVKRPGTPAAEAAQRAQAPEQNGDLQ